MRQGSVWEQSLCIENMKLVHTERQHLLLYAFEIVACGNGFQLTSQLIGQLAALGQQFEADIGNGRAFYFKIYEYVVHDFSLILSYGLLKVL